MKKEIVYGSEWLEVELPDDTVDLPAGVNATIPIPPVDTLQAVREALDNPAGMPPLEELAKRAGRVVIAFDDPTVASYAGVWEIAIREVVERLTSAGVKLDNIFSPWCQWAAQKVYPRGNCGNYR